MDVRELKIKCGLNNAFIAWCFRRLICCSSCNLFRALMFTLRTHRKLPRKIRTRLPIVMSQYTDCFSDSFSAFSKCMVVGSLQRMLSADAHISSTCLPPVTDKFSASALRVYSQS